MRYMILKLHGNEIRSSCDENLCFSPCASRLFDAAPPRTTSISWSVVKEDCNFSNFGTEAFLISCYLGHRFCTRFLTGEIHSMVMTKIKWSWHFFGADHRKVPNRPQNALFSRCMLKCGMYDSNINTRKDNLSVILSSLPLSHRFMLSRVIH